MHDVLECGCEINAFENWNLIVNQPSNPQYWVHPGFPGPEMLLVSACKRGVYAFLCWNNEDSDRFRRAWSAQRGTFSQEPISLGGTKRKPAIRRFRNAKTHPVFSG